MIVLFVLLFLAGAGLTAYGIWEQKNVYGDQHFATGRVVGYADYQAHGPALFLGAAMEMKHPVVLVTLDSGEARQLKIHTFTSYSSWTGIADKFPELSIGGEVSVTYFGKNPKEAYLVNHPLAQTAVKCSSFLIAGIAALAAAAFLIGSCIWFAQN